MTWIYLFLAGLLEVFWATTMKYSHGFTHLFYSILTIIGMIASFIMLSLSLKHLPLGIAYPVWTGIGAIGTIIASFILFHDKVSPITWLFVCLLIISILGIKLTSSH